MKTIFLSKTFWVQIIALLALVFPPVKSWFDANPVQYLTALAAVNVLLRFVTSGAVSILPASAGTDMTDCEKTGTSQRLPGWLLLAGLGGLVGFSSPACSPAGNLKFEISNLKDGATLHYSSKSGIGIVIDGRATAPVIDGDK